MLLQAARYVLVGGGVYLVDFFVYSLLVFYDDQIYLEANVAGRLTGAVVGFFFHGIYTFSEVEFSLDWRKFFKYGLLFGFNLVFSTLFLHLLVGQLGYDEYLSRVATDCLVVIYSFLVSKYFVYREC